ncbi:UNVERIFIED_CONTAM: hypothetical protein GTU68_001859 [Idotea baltica]|nr:hypothetical protein [Idotea baltica]
MTTNIHAQRILILDFGSQYTQLVARRIREIGVYCELWSWDVEESDIRDFNPDGIILSGGPESVTEANSPRAPQYVFDSGVPVFGVCYGMQTMAEQLGEVTHTKNGLKMLENFVLNVCGCEGLWTSASIIEDAVARIKEQVGDDEVILGLSGGVDSSVVAMLAHRAIGDKLTCVFVDNGLLRLNEAEQVMEMFSEGFGLKIIHVEAEERFLTALSGESDPEAKRKIIGHVFVDIFDEESKKLSNAKWLAQGTIYPDVIESAASKTGKAHVIKSHHNVGGLPDDMEMGLVEPLRELFKDEVRKIGLELGLPYNMLYRHPFPGPGLGVRVLGEVKKEYCDLLRRADAIFIEELHNADLYNKVSQAFTVFLPVRSVGVMGDGRKYDWVVSLRAVETIDFMTAHWAHLPYDFLGKVSNRIINEVGGISRVVYDISGKPPATIEWE